MSTNARTSKEIAAALFGMDFGYGPLDAESAEYWSKWRAHTGHRSGRWHVSRDFGEVLRGSTGRVVLFKSREAAQARADALNREEEALG